MTYFKPKKTIRTKVDSKMNIIFPTTLGRRQVSSLPRVQYHPPKNSSCPIWVVPAATGPKGCCHSRLLSHRQRCCQLHSWSRHGSCASGIAIVESYDSSWELKAIISILTAAIQIHRPLSSRNKHVQTKQACFLHLFPNN